jgi:GR25 family glycosyltransferase involved in LPS biosynthesis
MYNRQNIKNIPAYVICLDRKRKERCDINVPKIKEMFPKTTWVNAVDGNEIDYLNEDRLSIYAKYNIETKNQSSIVNISNQNEYACALSHQKIWKEIIKNNIPSIVIEDDINIEPKADEILQAIELIPNNIDFASVVYSNNDNNKMYDNNWFNIENISFSGMMLYLITPSGAKKLLKYFFPVTVCVDRYIGYISKIDTSFIGICYHKPLYTLFEQFIGELNSTLDHGINVKKILPENNSFYVILVIIIFTIIIGLIILVIYNNNKHKKCKIQLKKCKKK